MNTDWRKSVVGELEFDGAFDEYGSWNWSVDFDVNWVQSARMNHSVSIGYRDNFSDAQWMGNFAAAQDVPQIGGVSYVFGELENQTIDLTLRSNLLFTRTQSLEVYVQPFISTGEYSSPRALATPDSRDLQAYDDPAFSASDSDFRYASLNANFVYRWEYLPGSTLYLVWTHARGQWEDRGGATNPNEFSPSFTQGMLFDNEPENTFLVKLTYWLSI